MVTEKDIRQAYYELRAAITRATNDALEEMAAKSAYERARNERWLAGEIVGKNEAEREAVTQRLLATEYEAVLSASKQAKISKMNLDVAAAGVDEAKLVLRLHQAETYDADVDLLIKSQRG
jgi:hypothetical protein